jgi:hypothetical protein
MDSLLYSSARALASARVMQCVSLLAPELCWGRQHNKEMERAAPLGVISGDLAPISARPSRFRVPFERLAVPIGYNF